VLTFVVGRQGFDDHSHLFTLAIAMEQLLVRCLEKVGG
jgi:hypothetical protein